MAFTDLADSGFNLRKGPYKILEGAIVVHQTKKQDGAANPPFTALHVKWQPLTEDLKSDDGEAKDRYYSLTFKRNTDYFLPSEDDKTAAGNAVGTSGKFFVALKPSEAEAPDSRSEFGIIMSSLLNAGVDKAKLNSEGAGALGGLVVDVDIQSREGKADEKGVKAVYHNEIVTKIHANAPKAAAKATVKAAATTATATAQAAQAPSAAANGDSFDGSTWLVGALSELQAKFTGATKPTAGILGNLKILAAKTPTSKAWLAEQLAANGDFWHEALVDNGLGIVDGKQVTLT